MTSSKTPSYRAFNGDRCIAAGSLTDVTLAAKEAVERDESARVLVFDSSTSQPVELDLRGTVDEVLERIAASAADRQTTAASSAAPRRGPGRPRLGVVSREVTLLPRHWAWLAAQRGGASAALRRVVDRARRAGAGDDRARQAQDATYQFSSAMAGNQAGFEESMRALFAGNAKGFDVETQNWPVDIRDHARRLAALAFEPPAVSDPRDGNR